MKEMVDKNGNEIKRLSFQRIYELIKKNIGLFLAIIPLMGIVISKVLNFLFYIYTKGRASYFNLPDEYLIINYKISIYSIVIYGVIALLYVVIAIWNVRTILRKQSKRKKALCIIFEVVLFPMLFFMLLCIFSLNDPILIFSLSINEWIYFLKLSLIAVVLLHCTFVFTIGYFVAYPIQKDLIKEREKNKEQKIIGSYRWNNIDRRIFGVLICIVGVVFFGWYYYDLGCQSAEKQKDFPITIIDNSTYVIVMMDGNEAIIEKCTVEESEVLTINVHEYMKIECKNHLLQEKHFENVIFK